MLSSDLGVDVSGALPTIITSRAVTPPFVPSSLHSRPSSQLAPPLSRSPSASRRARRATRRPHTSDGGIETDSVSSSFAAAAAAQAQALSRQASVDTLTASLAAVSAQRQRRLSLVSQPPSESPSTPLPPVPAVPHHIPASPVLVSPSARTAADSPFRCKTCSKHAWDASSSHAVGERCLHTRTRKRPSTTPERGGDGAAPPPTFGRIAAELSGLPAPSRFELRAQDAERRAQAQRSPASRSPKRTPQPTQQAAMARTKSLDLSRPRDGFVDAPVDVLPEDSAADVSPAEGLRLDIAPAQPRGRKHVAQASESKALRFHMPAQKRSSELPAHIYPRTPALHDGEHGLALSGVEYASHSDRAAPEAVLYLPVSPRFSSSTAHSMPMFTPEGIEVKDDYFDLPPPKARRSSKTSEEPTKAKQSSSIHSSPLVTPQPSITYHATPSPSVRQAHHAHNPLLPAMPSPTSILQEQEQITGYSLTPTGSPKSINLTLSSADDSPRSIGRRTLHRVPSTPPTTPPTSCRASLKSPRQGVPSLPPSPMHERELRLPSQLPDSHGSKDKAAAAKTSQALQARRISEHSVFQYNATKGSAAHAEKHTDVGRKRGFWAGLNCFS
ncbi:hypothetical protein FA09DRAFT_357957 [Tilletiopsis washingtonensis]|jgi:hypothetical protein|uniref:Uncharacterized protein n=1 Tax=Tilletiopsis washingtonensis TaxID=58919 RepID=A0A316ZHZ3_9BASI|nr:hypothetical protein FA09DRAFT_357957 [Tilletiopsis washingtonensis]PWO01381.1 hypothetical protein FA09DRAFT_357957 [Tilletiopsis washingtonensis]